MRKGRIIVEYKKEKLDLIYHNISAWDYLGFRLLVYFCILRETGFDKLCPFRH